MTSLLSSIPAWQNNRLHYQDHWFYRWFQDNSMVRTWCHSLLCRLQPFYATLSVHLCPKLTKAWSLKIHQQ